VTWIFFFVLTMVHIYANYLGVSLLRLRTINTSRIDPCLHDMYSNVVVPQLPQASNPITANCTQESIEQYKNLRMLLTTTIASPTQIREIMFLPVWQFLGILPSSCIYCNTIPYHQLQPYFHQSLLGQLFVLQASASNAENTLESKSSDDASLDNTILSSLRYNVTIVMKSKTRHSGRIMKPKVAITLLTGATSNDELQAYIHAKIILILLQQSQQEQPKNKVSSSSKTMASPFQIRQILLSSYTVVQLLFQQPQHPHEKETNISEALSKEEQQPQVPLIIDILQQKDWDVSRFYFNYPPTRCHLVLDTTTPTTPTDNTADYATSATKKKDN
jgi:hypothetical protein